MNKTYIEKFRSLLRNRGVAVQSEGVLTPSELASIRGILLMHFTSDEVDTALTYPQILPEAFFPPQDVLKEVPSSTSEVETAAEKAGEPLSTEESSTILVEESTEKIEEPPPEKVVTSADETAEETSVETTKVNPPAAKKTSKPSKPAKPAKPTVAVRVKRAE